MKITQTSTIAALDRAAREVRLLQDESHGDLRQYCKRLADRLERDAAVLAVKCDAFDDKPSSHVAIRQVNPIVNVKGATIAIVDMKTGRVTLQGDPNEAARIFWQAVTTAFPVPKCHK